MFNFIIQSTFDIFSDLYTEDKLKTNKNDNIKFILRLITILAISLLIKNYVFSISVVKQNSMNNTLQDGDILVVSRINPTNVKKTDIVIVKNPDNKSEHKYFIKRVIAFEEDYIEIWKNILLVNDEILDEKYVTYNKNMSDRYSSLTINIPKGHIFVLGDNRDFSNDSRNFGSIPIDDIIAKVYIRIYPFDKFGFVE